MEILYISGEIRISRINFEENSIKDINTRQFGGVIRLSYSTSPASATIPTSDRRLISSTQPATAGSLMITGNNLTGVLASNGGVVYEDTTDTMNIILDSSIFNSISAACRGGV